MRLLLAVGVVIGLASLAAAGGKPDPKMRANKLLEDGRRFLTNKEYALACTAFEQSQEADPEIGTQLDIALCYEEWGHFASAYRVYVEIERVARLKSDDRANHARKKIYELQQKAPHLRVDTPDDADPSTAFMLDGKEIERAALAEDLVLDAGPHTVEARVPGRPPSTTTIDLHDGDHRDLVLDVPKAASAGVLVAPSQGPRNNRRFYGGLGMIGGGAVVVGIASLVALSARSDYNNAILGCPNNLCETGDAYRETQHDRSKANDMTIVGGAGLALAAVGVVFVLTSHGDRAHSPVVAAPLVAPGVVGLSLGGPL